MNATSVTATGTHQRRRMMAQYSRNSTVARTISGLQSSVCSPQSRCQRPSRARSRVWRAPPMLDGQGVCPRHMRFPPFALDLSRPMRRWRLRTGLLAPILLLVPLVLAATSLSWEAITRREAESLVAQRQATALAGLNARLKERQQANATIGYLLAKRDTIEAAMDAGNTLRLAQTL